MGIKRTRGKDQGDSIYFSVRGAGQACSIRVYSCPFVVFSGAAVTHTTFAAPAARRTENNFIL